MLNQRDVVLTSRIRLARNYDDLPFDTSRSQGIAAVCIQRTQHALTLDGADHGFALIRLQDIPAAQQRSLMESHMISQDLLQHSATGAVLLRADQTVSIMMNEEDHLRIQALLPGDDLQEAANRAFATEDLLARHVRFAFDRQLGYLTACPTNTGTGMRASLMLHLPLLTLFKQMGNVTQSVAKVGLTIRGIYGEGSEALGQLYQVSNQVTLGRTEQEIIEAVAAVGTQLADMEREVRTKALKADDTALQDQVFRSYGALRYARRMDEKEFMLHWSNLRLGVEAEKLPVSIEQTDLLLEQAQNGHLTQWAERPLAGNELNQARCDQIRRLLSE